MSQIPINPPQPVRGLLYLAATFGAPLVIYLATTDKIGDAMALLLGTYVTLVLGLATANTAGAVVGRRTTRRARPRATRRRAPARPVDDVLAEQAERATRKAAKLAAEEIQHERKSTDTPEV